MPKNSALILDNFERSSDEFPVRVLLEEYIDLQEPSFVLALLSRTSLPEKVSRFFVNGSLSRIEWGDLALTREEIGSMARARLGTDLSRDRTDRLFEQTNGWVAGVVLMLEHFRQTGDFGSDNPVHQRELFSYFASEIFGTLPPETQASLLAISFFPRLDARLLDTFLGLNPLPGPLLPILSGLNRNHFFIMLDSSGRFIFHPLFQKFLQDRLLGSWSEEESFRMMTLTGDVLEEDGDWEAAFDLFFRAKDRLRMTALIERRASFMVGLHRHRILSSWLDRLPPECFDGKPWLNFWKATALFPFDPARTREIYERAHAAFESMGEISGTWLSWCGIVQSILVYWDEFVELDHWLSWASPRLDFRPPFPDPELRALVLRDFVGGLVYRRPDHPDLDQWVGALLELSDNVRDPALKTSILWLVALYYGWIGEIGRGKMLIASLEMGSSPDSLPAFVRIQQKLALAIYGWLGDPPTTARVRVREGIGISESSGVHVWDAFLFAQAVYASLSEGEVKEGESYLAKLKELIRPDQRLHLSHFHYLSGWAKTLRGDCQAALFHTERALDRAVSSGAMFPEISCRLAHAQVLQALGRRKEGKRQIALASRGARAMGSSLLLFLCGIADLDGLMRETPDPKEKIRKTLKKVLTLGREGQYFNFQWWDPNLMARICRSALEMEIEIPYVRKMIALRRLPADERCEDIDSWPWTYRIFTLGSFRILKEGEPPSFSSRSPRKVLDMLYLIALEGRRAIRQEELIEALWPEADGDRAKGAFDVTLHRLRERFGEETVHLSGGLLVLNRTLCWTDIRALERLFQTLGSTLSGSVPDPREVDRCFGRLKSLYRETPSDRGGDPPRAVMRREKLHRLWVAAVRDLGLYHEKSGHWEKAEACYRYGLDIDPTQEVFLQHLMRTFSRFNRQEDIRSLFDRFIQDLSRSGREGPAPETRKLFKSLLSP
jgi:hypothetical protein